jgi:cobalt-zinc-cadmium resistance protein CzcA
VGVTAGDVQDVVGAAVGGREAGVIFEGDRRSTVVIPLAESSRADFQTLGPIPAPKAAGSFVPLASVADIGLGDRPIHVSRENGKRRVVVQLNVRGRDVAGVVADAQAAIAAKVSLSPGEYLQWGGQFENLASARERLMIVVSICFMVIMLLLYGALGLVCDAALVFTGVPLALVGGILALVLRGMPFSISTAVGFIALSGVAVLNGLVMVSSI